MNSSQSQVVAAAVKEALAAAAVEQKRIDATVAAAFGKLLADATARENAAVSDALAQAQLIHNAAQKLAVAAAVKEALAAAAVAKAVALAAAVAVAVEKVWCESESMARSDQADAAAAQVRAVTKALRRRRRKDE